jgi:hypothetical protein
MLLVVLGLAGCGSEAVADLPAPAGLVAGTQRAGEFSVDPAHDRLTRADGVSVQTGRQPTAVALLDRGAKVAVLCGRERTLEVYDARTLKRLGSTGAGIGPVGLATDGVQLAYVTDVKGDALLVFHLRPRFELIRRVHIIGGPYAIAYDQDRWELTITLSKAGQTVRYAAGNRPVLRGTPPR